MNSLPNKMKQHADLSRFNTLHFALVLASLLLINACSTTPTNTDISRAKIETREVATTQPTEQLAKQLENNDQATAYREQQYYRQRAEHYAQQVVGNTATTQNTDAILSAAEHYIQSSDHLQAQQQISQIDTKSLDQQQTNRLSVIKAYITYNNGDFSTAIQSLTAILDQNIKSGQVKDTQTAQRQIDAHLLTALSYQKLGNIELSIFHMAQREKLLSGVARGENARYLMTLIQALDESERNNIVTNTKFPDVRNRILQSATGHIGQSIEEELGQFQQWADTKPSDDRLFIASQWNEFSPRRVALLLPLTSRYKKAAMALRDGLIYQHEQNISPHQPIIETYDIGDNPERITAYYQAAIDNGADFVIGPLGKAYANQLTPSLTNTSTPSLLLGGEYAVDNNNVAKLTFSPEIEGINVAEMAFNLGYINAALVIPLTEQGKRAQQAFTAHWLNGGGKISRVVQYSEQQFDYRTELKLLFDINQSEYRHQQLSKTLGFKPKFNAYQRNDYDFIFMLANNATGRILKPQINFHNTRNTPILASESIYNGIIDQVNNTDLNKVKFPVIPWVIESEKNSPFAGQLNRLFAMGMDAYSLAGQFSALRGNPQSQISGKLGALNIQSNGSVHYKPVPAIFTNGLVNSHVISINTSLRDISNSQLLIEQRDHSSQQGREYNDNNWDARQNSRKASP